jgi:Ca2+-transporting ATPase
LESCTRKWGKHGEEPLADEDRKKILDAAKEMAKNAMRVLAVARKGGSNLKDAEGGMKFLGLVGMIDPPRKEAKDAIRLCKQAGIKVVMITGDHPLTAEAIAKELHYLKGRPLTGSELDRLSMAELEALVENTSVYARVTPEHKLKIVQALQNRGHIVAMTGDGINDAPALKKSGYWHRHGDHRHRRGQRSGGYDFARR